jgi:hypothetical protein
MLPVRCRNQGLNGRCSADTESAESDDLKVIDSCCASARAASENFASCSVRWSLLAVCLCLGSRTWEIMALATGVGNPSKAFQAKTRLRFL